MSRPPVPKARLYAILAREAPVAVIFRRGPSKWVQVIKWNTDTDTFEPGQWLRGRIYEKRCDLSPDGKLLVYFAADQGRINGRVLSLGYLGAWTAVSKLPYLTALALWPKGDTYDGGGLFASNTEMWLNHSTSYAEPHPDHLPTGLSIVDNGGFLYGEDTPILSRRLERDRWQTKQHLEVQRVPRSVEQTTSQLSSSPAVLSLDWLQELDQVKRETGGYFTHQPGVYVKKPSTELSSLTMAKAMVTGRVHTETVYRFTVTLQNGSEHVIPSAVWADYDQRDRIVFARDGKLFEAVTSTDALTEREIADFNGNRFEPIEAPDWARTW